MSARLAILLCLLLACAGTAVGCGSDDGDSSPSTDASAQSSSKDEPAEDDAADDEQDEIEGAYRRGLIESGDQLATAGAALEKSTDWPSYSAGVKQLRAAVASFAKLIPPDDVAAEHEDMITSLDAAVTSASKITANSAEAADEANGNAAMASLGDADESADSILAELDD